MDEDIIEEVLKKIRHRIDAPDFVSKVEVARLSMKQLLRYIKFKGSDTTMTTISCVDCNKPLQIIRGVIIKEILPSLNICTKCIRDKEDHYIAKIKSSDNQR